MLAAGCCQLRHQPAASGDDHRAMAPLNQGGGYFQGSSFDAAVVKGRETLNDSQHGNRFSLRSAIQEGFRNSAKPEFIDDHPCAAVSFIERSGGGGPQGLPLEPVIIGSDQMFRA